MLLDGAGRESLGGGTDEGGAGGVGEGTRRRSMRFIQLYTSPSFRNQRSKLVAPSEDWEQSERDVSKHKFSPVVSYLLQKLSITSKLSFPLSTFATFCCRSL